MPSHGMPGSRSWQHPQPWVRHERRRCGSSGRVEASGRSSFQDGSRACARPGHRLYSRHVVIVGRLRQTMSLVWRDDADEGRPAFARYDTSCLRERSGSNRAPGRSGDGLDEIVAEQALDEFALRRPSRASPQATARRLCRNTTRSPRSPTWSRCVPCRSRCHRSPTAAPGRPATTSRLLDALTVPVFGTRNAFVI